MLQVTTLIEELGASVVRLGRGARRGSGVVVAPDRVVVMSHSLRGEQVEVGRGDSNAPGTVLGSDAVVGISLVQVQTGEATPVTWAQDAPAPGDPVYALGDPGTGLRVTEGRVSASPLTFRGRSGRPLQGIEHTAPLPRGSGGGPLVDSSGAVVGLNALRTDPGFLFAIGTEAVRPAVERLLNGRPEPARLGIAIAPPRVARRMRRAVGLPEREGLLVRAVERGSAAERAGVRSGDLIVRAQSTDVASFDELFAVLDTSPSSLALSVVRGAQELELEVELSKEPA
jgi:serine protease Do